jgi:hypothetical protein
LLAGIADMDPTVSEASVLFEYRFQNASFGAFYLFCPPDGGHELNILKQVPEKIIRLKGKTGENPARSRRCNRGIPL